MRISQLRQNNEDRGMVQKVCVIGAGLIGSAIASALARRGAEVIVVSAGPLGTDTSSASLSWLNAIEKMPMPYMEMNLKGMQLHADYAARHSTAPWYHRGGNLRICADEASIAKQERILREIEPVGYRGGWIGRTELKDLEPDLDVAGLGDAQVAYFPDEAWINGPALVGRLLADARAAGASVMVPAVVEGFDMQGGRIAAVRLADSARLAADIVVNCAGPAAGKLAEAAGCTLPMSNEIGVQAYTAPAATTLGRVIHSPTLNMRPDGGGRICVHDYQTDGKVSPRPDADSDALATTAAAYEIDHRHIGAMLDRLAGYYPATAGLRAEGIRLGLRPIPKDRRPAVGFFPACSNFYAAVMHSGATLCLWAGELAAREIADQKVASELKTFRPERFLDGLRVA